jgi:hypothetical protein
MGLYRGPKIFTEGLTFALDAGTSRSYPGTGTSWTAIRGNSVGTLYNGVGYTTAKGGGLTFDGSNDYVELNRNDILLGTNPFTFECFYTINAFNGGGEIFGTYGSGYSSSSYVWISGEYGFYIGGAVYYPGYPLGAGTYCMTVTRTSFGYTVLYKNGVAVNTGTLTGSLTAGPNYRIGADTTSAGGVGGERLNGAVYSIKVYDRDFTADEVLNNYNAQKSRYGLT